MNNFRLLLHLNAGILKLLSLCQVINLKQEETKAIVKPYLMTLILAKNLIGLGLMKMQIVQSVSINLNHKSRGARKNDSFINKKTYILFNILW